MNISPEHIAFLEKFKNVYSTLIELIIIDIILNRNVI